MHMADDELILIEKHTLHNNSYEHMQNVPFKHQNLSDIYILLNIYI